MTTIQQAPILTKRRLPSVPLEQVSLADELQTFERNRAPVGFRRLLKRSCECPRCRARDARDFDRIATAYGPAPIWPDPEHS